MDLLFEAIAEIPAGPPTVTVNRGRRIRDAGEVFWMFTVTIRELPGLGLDPDLVGRAREPFEALFRTGLAFKLKLDMVFQVRVEGMLTVRPATIDIITFRADGAAGVQLSFELMLRVLNVKIQAYFDSEALRDEASGVVYIRILQARLKVVGEPRIRAIFGGAMPAQPIIELRGGTYVEHPPAIKKKHCCVNIKNVDNHRCFQLSLVCWRKKIYECKHPERLANYYVRPHGASKGGPIPAAYKLKWDDAGFDFSMLDDSLPVGLQDIPAVEEANDISIFVYSGHTIDGTDIFAIDKVYTPAKLHKDEVVLFLYEGHFSYVTNVSALLSCQGAETKRLKTGTTTHRGGAGACHRCDRRFPSREKLQEHLDRALCFLPSPLKKEREWVLPAPYKRSDGKLVPPVLSFDKYSLLHLHPCVVVADFETYFSGSSDPMGSQSVIVGRNTTACSAAWYVITANGFELPPELHKGMIVDTPEEPNEHVVEDFLLKMLQIGDYYRRHANRFPLAQMTPESWKAHREADKCYCCGGPFNEEKRKKVVEHCHITGRYRGAACDWCNKKMKLPSAVPCFLHNLQGYDGHLIFRGLSNLRDPMQPWADTPVFDMDEDNEGAEDAEEKPKKPVRVGDLRTSVIKRTSEKYSCIRFGRLQFLDSFAFMRGSLEKLIASHIKSRKGLSESLSEAFPIMWKEHPEVRESPERLEDLLRKIPYPYSWVTDRSCFDAPAVLPRESYYDDLGQKACGKRRYCLMRRLVRTFEWTRWGQIHDCYLWTDVLALADIFSAFRQCFFRVHEIDIAQTVTLPSASMQAMLKTLPPRKLELVCDAPGGKRFMELIYKNIRGGLSCCFQPRAQANNPYCPGYNPRRPKTWLQYIDVNSLYPFVMTWPMPEGGYDGVKLPDGDEERLAMLRRLLDDYDIQTSTLGYLIVVDYHIEGVWHDSLPFAPCVKTKVADGELSQLQLRRRAFFGSSGCEKLVPHLGPQKEVGLSAALLKTYMRYHRITVTKVHEIWRWRQSCWLKPYIEKVSRMRRETKDALEKDIYKLTMNAIFGKLCQDGSKYVNTTIYNDRRNFAAAVWRESMVDYDTIEEGDETTPFIGTVDTIKGGRAVVNTPRAAGFMVLEYSKVLMYQHFYGYVKPSYGPKAELLFMDTDSLMFLVETDDILEDMRFASKKKLARFDLSGGSLEWPNPGELGAFKYEGNYEGEDDGAEDSDDYGEYNGDEDVDYPLKEKPKAAKQTMMLWKYVGLQSKMYSLLYSRVPLKQLEDYAAVNGPDSVFVDLLKGIYKRPLTAEEGELLQEMDFFLTTSKKCKGVPKKALAPKTFQDYWNMSYETFEDQVIDAESVNEDDPRTDRATFVRIGTRKHYILHILQTKRCLSVNNDKVFQMDVNTSRPLGHRDNEPVLVAIKEELEDV